MREERIAARYGRALFLCVKEESELVQIEKELSLFSALVDAPFSELKTLLLNPSFTAEERARVVGEISSSFKFQSLTTNFLLLLIDKERAQLLSQISKSFSSEIDVRLGRVRAHISSAKALPGNELEEVILALQTRMGKDVIATTEVNPELLMGTKAQIGGLVFDGTLSTLLGSFKRKLIDTSIN